MSRAALFAFTNRWIARGALAAHSVNRGLWLGLMEPSDLQEATQRHYAVNHRYVGARHNLAGLMGWEARLVQEYLAGCRSVLVGAAGGGREVLTLARQGFEVEAFDCSPELVETARRVLEGAGVSARVHLALPGDVPRELGLYDGVLLGWGGYSHVIGPAARTHLLMSLATHLRPDGPLLFTFLTRGSGTDERSYRWTYRVAHAVRRLRRSANPVMPGDALFGPFAHRFTCAEIEREVGAAGLALEYYGDFEYGAAVARAGAGGPR